MKETIEHKHSEYELKVDKLTAAMAEEKIISECRFNVVALMILKFDTGGRQTWSAKFTRQMRDRRS